MSQPHSFEHHIRTAIGLHWGTALLIVAAIPLGLYMSDLPLSPDKFRLHNYHKWIGISVLIFSPPR